MLKISIVMLTTAVFAGLLIADSGGSISVVVARRTAVTAEHAQTGSPQPSQTPPSMTAKAVVQQDNPVVNQAANVVSQAANVVSIVRAETDAPASTLAPAPSSPERTDERKRIAHYRNIHMASYVVHHLRRRG